LYRKRPLASGICKRSSQGETERDVCILPCELYHKSKESVNMSFMEHPEITRCERTGFPDNRKDEEPTCPICGGECDTIYKDREGEIVGCNECLRAIDAWEVA
jgi:hypothetical protein